LQIYLKDGDYLNRMNLKSGFILYDQNAPTGGGLLPFFGQCPYGDLNLILCPRRGWLFAKFREMPMWGFEFDSMPQEGFAP